MPPSRCNLQTCPERRLQRQTPLRHRHLIRGTDLFHDALDKEVEDLQLVFEDFDELLIGFDPLDQLRQNVMPTDDIDPAALRDVELTLQLRSETFIDLAGNPVFDLCVRQGSLDFQQAVVADEPVGTAPHRVNVVGDEADPLSGYVLIEFIPIDRLRLDDQAPLHGRRIIEFDFALQYPLSD